MKSLKKWKVVVLKNVCAVSDTMFCLIKLELSSFHLGIALRRAATGAYPTGGASLVLPGACAPIMSE